MNESNSKPEKPKNERRYDPELLKKGLRCDLGQYEMLLRCSEEESITEWNEWRKKNKGDIYLEGANLNELSLEGIWLNEDPLNLYGKVYLEGATFRLTNLQGAEFWRAHLEEADFYYANLENATFALARLEGAEFSHANLKKASFPKVTVDGRTMIFYCKIDKETWFWGVGLGNMRIAPEAKDLLECNVRRIKWQQWQKWKDWHEDYPQNERSKVGKYFRFPIIVFLWISDYGRSTGRIIGWFFGLAFVFAIIYYAWGCIDYYLLSNKDYPGIVSNLFVLEDSKQAVSGWLVPLRSIYFSIVTMTTLGLGDMYANAHSLFRGIFGHILLALQVILGYVLLGALVTRFAVLFTAGGPAGKFADEKEKEDKNK